MDYTKFNRKDYTKFNSKSESEQQSFTEGCSKLTSDQIIESGIPLHPIACDFWEYKGKQLDPIACDFWGYKGKELVSVKFREYPNMYYVACSRLKQFLDFVLDELKGDKTRLNLLLASNPPAIKFSKKKTKRGFWMIDIEIVDEKQDTPF